MTNDTRLESQEVEGASEAGTEVSMLFSRFSLFSGATSVQARNASFLPRAVISAIHNLIEKPKGVGNAYTLFYTEQYPIFKKQFPDFTVRDIAKRVGAKWNALPEVEKKRYADRQAVGVEGAKQQMSQFKTSLNSRQSMALHMVRLNNRARRGEITRRHLKEEEKAFLQALPKTPFLNGRSLYMSREMRKKEGPVTERIGMVSAVWNALPASEKSLFENQAKLDQQQFQTAMKKFLYDSP